MTRAIKPNLCYQESAFQAGGRILLCNNWRDVCSTCCDPPSSATFTAADLTDLRNKNALLRPGFPWRFVGTRDKVYSLFFYYLYSADPFQCELWILDCQRCDFEQPRKHYPTNESECEAIRGGCEFVPSRHALLCSFPSVNWAWHDSRQVSDSHHHLHHHRFIVVMEFDRLSLEAWQKEQPLSILQLDPADRAVLRIAGRRKVVQFLPQFFQRRKNEILDNENSAYYSAKWNRWPETQAGIEIMNSLFHPCLRPFTSSFCTRTTKQPRWFRYD